MSFSWFLEEDTRYVLREWRNEAERARLIARLGNGEMVVTYWDAGDEIEGTRGGTYAKRLTVEQLASEIQDDSRWHKYGDLDGIETLDDLAESYSNAIDSDWGGVVCVLTPEAHEQREQEERRGELEAAAGEFARTHNVAPGSFPFIEALHEELQRVQDARSDWNSGERRMEEWAACQYAGVGSEVYFDDLNFENGRFANHLDQLRGIFDWLDENCPLLMAKWRETRLEQPEDCEEECEA